MSIVETKNLIKRYGRTHAVDGLSLQVAQGEIFGLLGQNGAGKTTLTKILLGIARGWKGHASLMGQRPGSTASLRRVGYLPEDHRFPDYHTGLSLLDFYGQLLGVRSSERRRRAEESLEIVGLTDARHDKIRTYSKGMKQRVGLAQAMFHDPDVIFLDEPTDGVDPLGRRDIRIVLQQLKDRGKTIILNSHLLSEVELICDRVGIMKKGKMLRLGDVATLTRQRDTFHIGLADGQSLPVDELRHCGFHVKKHGDHWEVTLADSQSIDPVLDLISARGLRLRHLVEKRQTLEDLFVETMLGVAEDSYDEPSKAIPVLSVANDHIQAPR